MPFCMAFSCFNHSNSDGSVSKEGVTFHEFPKDPDKKIAWVKAVGRKNWKPSYSNYICSDHFEEKYIDRTTENHVTLLEDAIPTIFEENDNCKKSRICNNANSESEDLTDENESKEYLFNNLEEEEEYVEKENENVESDIDSEVEEPEYTEESLICMVKNNPVLYDKSFPGYGMKVEQNQAWRELAVHLNVHAEDCQQHWEALLNRYIAQRKVIHKFKAKGKTAVSTWPLYSLINFMDKHLDFENHMEVPKTNAQRVKEFHERKKLNQSQAVSSTVSGQEISNITGLKPNHKTRTSEGNVSQGNWFKEGSSHVEINNMSEICEEHSDQTTNEILNNLTQTPLIRLSDNVSVSKRVVSSDGNEDVQFVNCILPMLVRMKRKKKALCKAEIMTILANYESEEEL